MKFIHLSDLHIGKKVHELSMIDEQKYILQQILTIIDDENPDAILIAGDVYDKSVPSTDAVNLLDEFLCKLAKRKKEVFLISGNHDSPERLSFASDLIELSGVHISPVYNGRIEPYCVKGVNIYLLPFIKPVHVRRYYEEKEINNYTDAMCVAIESMNINTDERNILVAHQFVTNASRTDSEDVSVGGLDNVDTEVFAPFDYVALGHIHRPQNCGSEKIRYCGTPLKYSFSEAKDHKSVTVGEIDENKKLSIRTVDLIPEHDMVELKGTFADLKTHTTHQEDYVHIILTDEEEIMDAMSKLRGTYHRLLKLDYDNKRTRCQGNITAIDNIERKTPLELFEELFKEQNGQEMNEEQRSYMQKMIEEIWEG